MQTAGSQVEQLVREKLGELERQYEVLSGYRDAIAHDLEVLEFKIRAQKDRLKA